MKSLIVYSLTSRRSEVFLIVSLLFSFFLTGFLTFLVESLWVFKVVLMIQSLGFALIAYFRIEDLYNEYELYISEIVSNIFNSYSNENLAYNINLLKRQGYVMYEFDKEKTYCDEFFALQVLLCGNAFYIKDLPYKNKYSDKLLVFVKDKSIYQKFILSF